MSTTPYRESQVGWLFLGIMLPVIAFSIPAYYFQWGNNPINFWGFIVLFVLLSSLTLLYYRLQTTVSYRKIELRYGIGLIKIQPKVDELIAVEADVAKWWYGLGTKITPKGMMYSIQGLKVVRLTYRKGSTKESIMIGTAQPEQLKKSLMENFELMQNPTV
ncbi:MAG: hypothetical protein RIF33_20135 [Cyclobacteriaceae bacterium]